MRSHIIHQVNQSINQLLEFDDDDDTIDQWIDGAAQSLFTHRVLPEQLDVVDVFGLEGRTDRLGQVAALLEVSVARSIPDPQVGSPLLTLTAGR